MSDPTDDLEPNLPPLRIAWPDTHDQRQAVRTGAGWPTHKARARSRQTRRRRKEGNQ